MKGIIKRLCTGFLALATILTALPTTAVHAAEKQYWTTGKEKAGVIEKVMNDGSIGSTFMKAGSSLRAKPPIVSTSTRTLSLGTRPEPTQAHA
ncbi:TPA: hypothetical protein ACSVR1_003591 [Clostridioides difficile]